MFFLANINEKQGGAFKMKFRNQANKYGSSEIDFRDQIPEFGFLRLWQIIGDSKSDPPVLPIFPICAASWWAGVRSGRYPAPVKLGPNTTAWTVASIRGLIEKLNNQEVEL